MQFLFADAAYLIPISYIIWAICIGVNLAFILSFISRNIVGKIVRSILSFPEGEECGKTFAELGFKKVSFFAKILLKEGSSLRSIVQIEGGQIPTKVADGSIVHDWENAKLFIPESQRKRAESLYGKRQRWIFLPIFMIVSIGLSALMAWLMPILMNAII